MDIDIAFQPFGENGASWTLGRRIVEIRSGRYEDLLAAIGFVTSSGTARLGAAIRSLVDAGGRARFVCGVGNGVTSRQAVEHLLHAGGTVCGVAPGPGLLFHQKVIRMCGPSAGLLIVGSNNLTADGLFRHFEGAAILSLDQ